MDRERFNIITAPETKVETINLTTEQSMSWVKDMLRGLEADYPELRPSRRIDRVRWHNRRFK